MDSALRLHGMVQRRFRTVALASHRSVDAIFAEGDIMSVAGKLAATEAKLREFAEQVRLMRAAQKDHERVQARNNREVHQNNREVRRKHEREVDAAILNMK